MLLIYIKSVLWKDAIFTIIYIFCTLYFLYDIAISPSTCNKLFK